MGQCRVVFRGRLADLVFCKRIYVTCDISNQEFAPMSKPTTNETAAVKPDTTPRVLEKWVLPDNCVIVERTPRSTRQVTGNNGGERAAQPISMSAAREPFRM